VSRHAGFPFLFRQSRRTQTILDQMIVSGSNFVTGIILVRGLGLSEFGKFTVAYAILLLANSVQLSFISSPMLTLGSLCSTPEERHRFVRGIFGVQLVFCAVATLLATVAAISYLYIHPGVISIGFVLAFAAGVVFYLMQDWLRRYFFTIGKAGTSVWNDAISYLGQLVVLCVLFWTRRLTIETAFWAIAITSGLAFAIGAVMERISCTTSETREAWQQARGISVDLGIANQMQWLVYQGAMLVGASVVGAQAAGGVRATQNVIGPVNVAFQAMENIVPIRAAEEMRRGGIQQAARFLFRFGFAGFVALLVVFLIASMFSAKFLSLFYGHQLRAYSGVLNLQMLYFLLAWPVRQLTFLFRTIRKTSPILISSITAALISMLLVYPLVRRFDAMGIVMAAVAGQVGNLLYLVIAWMRASATSRSESFETQIN
jgi:O-antigen/teichoic acid export membrane protein